MKTPPSKVLVNGTKRKSASTPSEEKQMDEVLNNQIVDFHTYLPRKKNKLNIEHNRQKCFSDRRRL